MPASERDSRTARTASLTLANAMIFQQVIANHRSDVQPLEPAIQSKNPAAVLDKAWTHILNEVDYIPIFTLAREVLRELKGTPNVDAALKDMAAAAQRITARRAALRHDLMGRVYHRLLADKTRKYFGAFYTTIPAATLLLRLALPPKGGIDWSGIAQIAELRVADLACGTGTLLKAAVQAIADNHVRGRAEAFLEPDWMLFTRRWSKNRSGDSMPSLSRFTLRRRH